METEFTTRCMTKKYKTALEIAIEATEIASPYDLDQEALYSALNKQGFFWSTDKVKWVWEDCQKADPPSPPSNTLKVRVWAPIDMVSDMADGIAAGTFAALGLKTLEKSPVYPCWPPKQLDGRVCLTFQLRREPTESLEGDSLQHQNEPGPTVVNYCAECKRANGYHEMGD